MATFAGRWYEALIRDDGTLVKATAIPVYAADGTTPAILYVDRGKSAFLVGDPRTDPGGNLELFADPGEYFIELPGQDPRKITIYEDNAETVNYSDIGSLVASQSALQAEIDRATDTDTALNNALQDKVTLPPTGFPKSYLEQPVQDSLDKADAALSSTRLNAVNGVAGLGADGKVFAAQIPSLTYTDTFQVASQAAMLALASATPGDIAVRSDLGRSFILTGLPPSTLGNWTDLGAGTGVTSVNGRTGLVDGLAEQDDFLNEINRATNAENALTALVGAKYTKAFGGIGESDLASGVTGKLAQAAASLPASDLRISYPPPVLIPTPPPVTTMIDNMQGNLSPWIANGDLTKVADTSMPLVGGQSMKLTTNGSTSSTQVARYSMTPVDISHSYMVTRVRSHLSPDGIHHVRLWVSSDNFATTGSYMEMRTTAYGRWNQDDAWQQFVAVGSRDGYFNGTWLTGGAHANFTAINAIKFEFGDNTPSGAPTGSQFWIGSIEYAPRPTKATIGFQFDRCWDTQFTIARKYLAKYDMPATLMIDCNQIGVGGRLSLSNLRDLHDNLGWEVAPYCYDPAVGGVDPGSNNYNNWTTFTKAQVEADIVRAKQYLRDNGFTEATDVCGGMVRGLVGDGETLLRKHYGYALGTGQYTRPEFAPPQDPMRSQVRMYLAPYDDLTTLKGEVDRAIANGEWLTLKFHDLGSTASGLRIDETTFGALVDYVQTKVAAGQCQVESTAQTLRRPTGTSSTGGGGSAPSTGLTSTSKVFDPYDYGMVADGVTDDTTSIQNAWAALQAAGEGTLRLPNEDVLLNKPGALQAIPWDGTNTGLIKIEGNGCRPKFGTNTRMWLYASGANCNNLEMSDVYVDCNNLQPAAWGQNSALFQASTITNMDNVFIHNCEVKNMPIRGFSDGLPWRMGISGGAYINVGQESTPFNVTNFRVEDCRFYGGNFGVLLQSFYAGPGNPGAIFGNGFTTASYMHNIFIRRCYHNTGTTGSTNSMSNFMVGSQANGGRVVVEDCEGWGSFDDGIEIGSFYDITIRGNRIFNCPNAGIYLANLGGMVAPWRQRALVENNECPGTRGIGVNQVAGSGPLGHVTMVDNRNTQYEVTGNLRSLTIRGHRLSSDGVQGNNATPLMLTMNQLGGKCVLTLEDIDFDLVIPTGSSGFAYPKIASIDDCTNLTLNINNVRARYLNVGGVGLRATMFGLNVGQRSNFREQFGATYNLGWRWYSGTSTGTDVATSAGHLIPVANTSTEQRMVAHIVNNDYFFGQAGPLTDTCHSVLSTPGATITGYKSGLVYWNDATHYLDSYVTDDGTNSYLCVDKVIGGTRTSLLGTVVGGVGTVTNLTSPASYQSSKGYQLPARIANGSTFSTRAMIRGNTVTVDYWNSSLRTDMNASGSTQTATVTLTGTDVETFGVTGQGYGGICWVPMGTDAWLDDFYWDKMYVYRGSINNTKLQEGSGMQYWFGMVMKKGPSQVRIDGQLKLNGNDWSASNVSQPMMDISAADTSGTAISPTLMACIERSNHTYGTPPTASAITVGASPFVYQNADGYKEQVAVRGGTVSDISVSYDGTTYLSVGAATGEILTLSSGDYIKVTYSVAPSMLKIPIR